MLPSRLVIIVATSTITGAAEIPRKPLPALVQCALTFVPMVSPKQVVLLETLGELHQFLRNYTVPEREQVIRDAQRSAEFTIDQRFPIFINKESWHYRRILLSWEHGRSPTQAARVLASDIYHEYRHAACEENESQALLAHLYLLKTWRSKNLLTIADPYIQSKETELSELKNQVGSPPFQRRSKGICPSPPRELGDFKKPKRCMVGR